MNTHHNDVPKQLIIIGEKIQKGQLDEALSQLENFLKIKPNNALAIMRLGEISRKKSEWLAALEYFQKAALLDPEMLWPSLNLAIELKRQGDFSKAEQQLLHIQKYHPRSYDIWVRLGENQQAQGHLKQALSYYRQAIDLDCVRLWARLKLAETLRMLEKFDEAEYELRKLLEENPDHKYDILKQLGYLEWNRKKQYQALQYFRDTLEEASSEFQQNDIQVSIAEILRDLSQFDEAANILNILLKKYPEYVPAKISLGMVFTCRNQFSEASRVFQEVLKNRPEHVDAHVRLAKVLHYSQKTEQAIELLRNSPSIVYIKPQIQQQLGELYRSQNERKKAIEYFRNVLAANPANIDANIAIAIDLIHSGSFDIAKNNLQEALKYHPRNLRLLLQLGDLEQEKQQPECAISYYQEAWNLHPHRAEGGINIVKCLMSCHRLDEAETLLEQLLRRYPTEWVVIMQVGYLARRRGCREDALEQFRKAEALAGMAYQCKTSQVEIIDELRALGLLKEAKLSIDNLLEFDKYNVRGKLHLGGFFQQNFDFYSAKNIYKNILEKEPKHLQATISLARIYAQLDQVDNAIELLEDTHHTLGPNVQVLMQLGQLAIAMEDLDIACQWYDIAYKAYPLNPQVICALASIMALQGNVSDGLALLVRSEQEIPHAVDISLKYVQIRTQFGYLEGSFEKLKELQSRFPEHIPLQFQLTRLYLQTGAFTQAKAVLASMTGDSVAQNKQIRKLRGDLALLQFDLNQAEQCFLEALELYPPQQHERIQMARILLLKGQINEAHHQLELATEELEKRRPPGQVGLPIKSHVAMVINEFRMNPPMMAQLQEAQEEEGRDRLLALGSLLAQEPAFLGAAIHLSKELRVQGIFERLQRLFPRDDETLRPIPKSIVQFWDEPNPPEDVCTLGQTWVEHNPDYKYKRFSLREAIAFLQQYYDDDILQAFRLCSHAATQADLFRLAYLNKMGGFYADADDRCLNSLEELRLSKAELIVYQEDFACFGNNFLGCVPGQPMIRAALYQAVDNLLNYSAEWAWSQTGPGLLTSAVCSGLLPYLAHTDDRMWPRLWVMTRGELTAFVWVHVQLAYKGSEKSWQSHAYPKTKLITPAGTL